ncbi:hypothetical protein FM037_20380 [Shewanella psychropiezotolerans]|uniref:OmpR/PhoB-type domain-containing protein n=1 Tax=Shewanella psychropiezotolerans TaxID=2593655 RepID=A0ABX5X401_9GAMM|nr:MULTISPECIES: winged helix-turn-helix domain-containing protein [Shewanella]MPY21173.1 hypothetical protein [Shewanella sp. YLB-07]MPY21960.1 hypothetical protein [Shewanella sp. YLB-07]QDO85162.1 hypothetical protein FM037_20380 [Shewanella psychropiezotolerans]
MAKVSYQIDNWIFIPHENKLILDGQETLIDNRLSNLLLYLCQNPMTTLSRDELIDEVWKGLVLTDQVITQAIFELRKILKTNHKHLQGYIITVPKRGYKLDINIQVLPSTNKTDTHTEKESLTDGHIIHVAGIRQEASPDDKKHIDSISNKTAIDNKNIQLNQSSSSISAKTESLSKQNQNNEGKSTKKATGLTAPIAITTLIFCLILLVFISPFSLRGVDKISKDTNSEEKDRATQFGSEVIYNNLEPRFIRARINTDITSAQIQHGVIFKIVEYLKYNVNFRIAFHNTPHNDAAKELTFIITEENGVSYINVEYFNRISQYQHLDRKYRIDNNNLKPTINRMLSDILTSFNVDVSKEKINELLSSMPEDPQALAYTLEAFAALHTPKDQLKSVGLMRKALELAPDNHYLLSTNYIYSMVVTYLNKGKEPQQQVDKLNQAFEKIIPILVKGIRSDKVNEALAMNALSKDRPIEALKYLKAIPNKHETVITFILKAKLSESFGNPATAEEYYYQAIHESETPRVLEIAESLFFYSDLSKMKSKMKAQIH